MPVGDKKIPLEIPSINTNLDKGKHKDKDKIKENENSNQTYYFVVVIRDTFFALFLCHLLAQIYHLYEYNYLLWNGTPTVLSIVLVVGDPMLHTAGQTTLGGFMMNPYPNSNNNNNHNYYFNSHIGSQSNTQSGFIGFITGLISQMMSVSMEHLFYLLVLGIAAFRAVAHQSTKSIFFSIFAILLWVIAKTLPGMDDIAVSKPKEKSNSITNFGYNYGCDWSILEKCLAFSIYRGIYFTYLAAVMPVLCLELPELLYDRFQVILHIFFTWIIMTFGTFHLTFIHNRRQIVLDLRKKGLWELVTDSHNDNNNNGVDNNGGHRKGNNGGIIQWKSDQNYVKGQIVSITSKEKQVNRWILLSNKACSSIRPSELNRKSYQSLFPYFSQDIGVLSQSNVSSCVLFVLIIGCLLQIVSAFMFVRSVGMLVCSLFMGTLILFTSVLIRNNFRFSLF